MGKLRIGIDLHNRASVFMPEQGLEYDLNRLVDLAVLCEELGFDCVSVGDSLLAKPRWRAIPTMAAIAARTRRIKVMSHILMPHYFNNPVLLAQELATLDEISQGRLILGCGIGAGKTALVEQEHRLCGVPKARRGKVFEETIHLLKKLWTEEEVTFRGEFYNLEGVRLGLRPRQRPHPPIWIAAGLFFTGQRGSGPFGDEEPAQEQRRGFIAPVDRVARLGDGWLTNQCTAEEFKANLEQIRELARKHGRDPSTITTAYNRGVFVDADVKRGFEEVKWFEYSYHAMPVPDETIRRWTIFGAGPECVRQMEPFVQAGVETFIICVRARDMFAQVRALAREVLPAFR